MEANDYYGHYKSFVKELSNDPELTLQQYCGARGVIWRRLYDWMRRNRISLKRLYAKYRDDCNSPTPVKNEELPEFREIMPRVESVQTQRMPYDGRAVISKSRIMLPEGIVIELDECPVRALSVLLGLCMGKEVRDVHS